MKLITPKSPTTLQYAQEVGESLAALRRTAVAHIGDLAGAARALHAASKQRPQPGASPANPLPALKALQRAVAAAEDVVVADILASACKALNAGCFAAGTKLLTRRGWVAVEEIGVGDEVASRSELDPRGAVEWKGVEATFRRTGRILHLHFPDGELIRTTPEHPLWAEGTAAAIPVLCGKTVVEHIDPFG